MKIDIFDFNKFIELNAVKEVTSPIVFARGGNPDPDGLLSNIIFGIDTKSRKNTFAYTSLHGHFFHPHIYKSLRRLYRNIERIASGTEYYSITEDGELVKDDENGHTGLEWIYKNWEKIDWSKKLDEESSSMREERVNLLKELKKNEIFVDKMLIIPVFYRDIMPNSAGGGETDPLNNMYTKLIRLGKVLADRDMFDFSLNSTGYIMQTTLVEIYDTFKHKIEKKNGMIRKYLMGKNVDNCVRSVISCPLYHDDTPEETGTKFGYVGVPISQILDLDAPFMVNWLKNFFDRNFISNKEQVPILDTDAKTGEKKIKYIQIYKPELTFTDKYFTDMMELYMRDPESRFDPIKVPIAKGVYKDVLFTGKRLDPSTHAEISVLASRPMTLTDLFYIASMELTKNQHALITRYPVSDAYGLFVARVNPVSTLMTEVVQVNGVVYTHYPKQDMTCTRQNTGVQFIDTLQFSNSYLAGLGGDYDGDQVTLKLIWSLEANKECESVMNSKTFFVSPNGENVRTIKYEVYQTFYDMTREPYTTSRHLGNDVKEQLLAKDPKEFTFSFLRSLFGDTAKKEESGKVRIKKSRYEVTDIIHLEAGEYHNASACDTTIGRICWNKIMIDRVGLRRYFPYMNDVLIKKRSTKYESDVTQLLNDDKIDTTTFRKYIDHRDWLGLTLHGLITVSFTEKTIKTPASVKKLRDELFKKYEKELAAGDIVVAGKIEKELVNKMVEIIKDDPGFDLYNSGARGDINNHLKNLFIMRGGVLNPNTGKYDIMKTSFNEGLRKEDFTAASNSVVQGAYPKSCATASTGYLAKQLMAGLQTEVIGPPGSDCGTKFTLEYDFDESDINDFNNRYIDVNGSKVLLTRENAKKYVGKTIHLYSPFGCIGVGKNNECLCEKCAGIQNSKYVGLNSNKVATVLTNLNMKKFHDSTLRFKKITPDSILLNPDHNDNGLFTDDGSNIKVDTAYMEVYVPSSYFENSFMAENLGGMINLFGIVPIGIFKNGKFDHFDTMNIPSWHKYFTYDEEIKNVELPGLGKTQCHVYKYIKGQKFCINELLEDATNAQLMLRFATYGKIPGTVPYGKALNIWRKNKKMNNVNFGVPSVIEEVILSTAYRWKKNPAYKFAKIIGKHPDMNLYDYEMASIRRICQVTSTFTGITFESFDDMVSTAINRSRTGGIETESPLEELFKL